MAAAAGKIARRLEAFCRVRVLLLRYLKKVVVAHGLEALERQTGIRAKREQVIDQLLSRRLARTVGRSCGAHFFAFPFAL
jgi:hypothetical protein